MLPSKVQPWKLTERFENTNFRARIERISLLNGVLDERFVKEGVLRIESLKVSENLLNVESFLNPI